MNEAIRAAAAKVVAQEKDKSAAPSGVSSVTAAALKALRAAETDEQEVEALKLLVDSIR